MPRPDEATPDTGWGLLPRSLTGTGVRLSVTWLVSRLIMLEFALPFVNDVTYDVYYYWQRVSPLGRFGSTGTLEEYPIPVVWILDGENGRGSIQGAEAYIANEEVLK